MKGCTEEEQSPKEAAEMSQSPLEQSLTWTSTFPHVCVFLWTRGWKTSKLENAEKDLAKDEKADKKIVQDGILKAFTSIKMQTNGLITWVFIVRQRTSTM